MNRKNSFVVSRIGSTRTGPMLAATLSITTVMFFVYCRKDSAATSENLLLALIFVASTLYFTSRNKRAIQHYFLVIKNQFFEFNLKRFGLGYSKHRDTKIQWFIDDSNEDPKSSLQLRMESAKALNCTTMEIFTKVSSTEVCAMEAESTITSSRGDTKVIGWTVSTMVLESKSGPEAAGLAVIIVPE